MQEPENELLFLAELIKEKLHNAYTLNNEEIAKVNIIAETDVAKNTFLNVVNHIYQNWVCTLR